MTETKVIEADYLLDIDDTAFIRRRIPDPNGRIHGNGGTTYLGVWYTTLDGTTPYVPRADSADQFREPEFCVDPDPVPDEPWVTDPECGSCGHKMSCCAIHEPDCFCFETDD